MYGWQPPHRMPAPQRAPTSSTESAPETTAASTVRSVTRLQAQTNTKRMLSQPKRFDKGPFPVAVKAFRGAQTSW